MKAQDQRPSSQPANPDDTHRPVTVFLVEDDDIDTEAIRRAFRKAKLANPVVRARDGREALAMLRRQEVPQPCVILLDINMPRMNGHEFLEALRADEAFSALIVFVLTTSTSEQDRMKAYEQHIAGYMIKDEVGEQFSRMLTMLDAYWTVVHLPPASGRGTG